MNDEIAIQAYLGRSFEEDGFTRHFAGASRARVRPASPRRLAFARVRHRSGAISRTGRRHRSPPPLRREPARSPAPRAWFSNSNGCGRAVEGLADDRTVKVATVELVTRGDAAIPVLLEALERREPILRRRAFELLKFVARDSGPHTSIPTPRTTSACVRSHFCELRLERRR